MRRRTATGKKGRRTTRRARTKRRPLRRCP
uniref:Uncharacterized protein n=1 Tax=Arundo donax TaxID=35708 RepID=A0A0A8Z5J3_ARUDO